MPKRKAAKKKKPNRKQNMSPYSLAFKSQAV